MTTLLAFAFVLGVLVFVHELGHFMMARWHGVRVLVFSLGFGPKLLKIKRGDTEYAISAIPLGGYVKMAGENPEDQRTGSDDEFLSKTKWQRFQILIMGPLMNLGLAVVLMAIVLMQGAEVPSFQDDPVVIGKVEAGFARRAARGFDPGDHIIAVDDDEVPTWDRFSTDHRDQRRSRCCSCDRPARRAEQNASRSAPWPRAHSRSATSACCPTSIPSSPSIVPGSPAEQAGLQPGDVILAINGERDGVHAGRSRNHQQERRCSGEMRIRRDGAGTDDRPSRQERRPTAAGSASASGTRPTTLPPGPLEAIGLSVQRNIEFSGLILKTLWGLIIGETSPKQLMGPVGIAQLSGESAQAGWIALFTLMATDQPESRAAQSDARSRA